MHKFNISLKLSPAKFSLELEKQIKKLGNKNEKIGLVNMTREQFENVCSTRLGKNAGKMHPVKIYGWDIMVSITQV